MPRALQQAKVDLASMTARDVGELT